MTEQDRSGGAPDVVSGVGSRYAAFQLAKALTTVEQHADPVTRARAAERASRWSSVLTSILSGTLAHGSRTPVEGVPAWVTLEVVTGGFATGAFPAGGPLRDHERTLLAGLPTASDGEERRALNAHFLTEAGLADLAARLHSGCYDVGVPEEGALLVVAWLVERGLAADARALLDQLAPWIATLRFYPIPLERPRHVGSAVHLQDVGETIAGLRGIRPNERLLAQQEAARVWAPFQDRIVALFLETVEAGWPCRRYPNDWARRARALLDQYTELRVQHQRCGKHERARDHSAQLRAFLDRAAANPAGLTGKEVGRIRLILDRHVAKWGVPGSGECSDKRGRQAADVGAPTFDVIAGALAARLEAYAPDSGLESPALDAVLSVDEVADSPVPAGAHVPPSIRRKVERCLHATIEELIERGLVTSGDVVAQCLPQVTSGIRALGVGDPALRRLYAAIYRAFRARRSLLLLNLERQVRIEELPWVVAIERFRTDTLSSQELAKQAMEEIVVLTLTSFPHAILPNKLLQELRALAKSAGVNLPLVDELAADIFMGRFSVKFVESARLGADLLRGSLYAAYYGVDYDELRRIEAPRSPKPRWWFWRRTGPGRDALAQLCASRAGVSLGTWDPATNGMIIEQQQILTTQNLAALFVRLDLAAALRGQLDVLARSCFEWICRQQQVRRDGWHAQLKAVKNAAHAWRQMTFFLALLPGQEVAEFIRWAQAHLDAQPSNFRQRFAPALRGLTIAAQGGSIDPQQGIGPDSRRFLGWSTSTHWLLAEQGVE